MLAAEPTIRVGILDRCRVVRGRIDGFCLVAGRRLSGFFRSQTLDGLVALFDSSGRGIAKGREIRCTPEVGATFTLFDVAVGIRFHWERKEEQAFGGNLVLLAAEEGAVTAINEVGLEAYLSSVVPSEMNPEGPPEFLKAQAITSRSWLAAMLERAAKKEGLRRRKKSTEKARPFAGMTGRLMIFLTSVPTTTASVTGGSQRPSRSGRPRRWKRHAACSSSTRARSATPVSTRPAAG